MLIAIGAVPSVLWAVASRENPTTLGRGTPDPRYATQSGRGAREAHVRNKGDHSVDAAIETCEGLGVPGLARLFDMKPEASLLARRFASAYEPAFRDRAYVACMRGLSGDA